MEKVILFICGSILICSGIVFATNKVSVVAQTGEFIDVLSTPINDGSTMRSVWSGPTNSLYIVSPNGAYTNLIMTTVGE